MRWPSRCRTIALALALLPVAGCGGTTATSTSPTTGDGLVDMGNGLRGPAGLRAAVASTGAPNVAALSEDASGRLWFATADHTDDGGDGVYLSNSAASTPQLVIADLHTVLGLLWAGDSLFVASKERVDAYTGFDGATFTEHHDVVTFASGVGEVNGLAMGADGRLWLGISAPCDSCVPTVPDGGAVVSFNPDGTDLRIEATGIRAAVGLTFVPATNDLLVTMNQRDDLGADTPGDYLALVAKGQDWGQPGCYGQGGDVCDGVPEPVAVLDRHAALGGVAVVGGMLTGGTAANSASQSAIVAEWATGVVQRVGLVASGGADVGTVSTFVTGITKPMAVLTTRDGAVLIGDWATGTIYRIESST